MCRFVFFITLAGVFLLQGASRGAAQSQAVPRPELPYFDWNACPFEACAYGRWTAREVVPLYDTWNEKRRQITHLAAGDKVVAVTGVVITFKPGLIRMDRDVPDDDLKSGDTISLMPIAEKVFRRFGSRVTIIRTSTSHSRSGRMGEQAAAVHAAQRPTLTWARERGGPK
jgi:hypothetical protein